MAAAHVGLVLGGGGGAACDGYELSAEFGGYPHQSRVLLSGVVVAPITFRLRPKRLHITFMELSAGYNI